MLIEKFEEQVRKAPGKTAVNTGAKTYSYEELNRRANRVARLIENRWPGNGRSDTVGLLFGHDTDMIVAILGALKAGKVYVSLSPDYPENRLSYMLGDAGASLIVTGSKYEDIAGRLAPLTGIDSLNIDAPGNNGNSVSGENRRRTADPGKAVYIIYTSGSTGKPKGVFQNHENVWYYVRNWVERFSITAADNMTLLTSLSHDGAVQDIFAALLTGATLCPYNVKNKETTADSDLSEFLTAQKITLWHSVPSVFNYFAGGLAGNRTFPGIRVVALGGAEVREHHINLAATHFPNAVLANVYGQTESSVNSIWMLRPGETFKKVTLGRPLDNTKMMLVNDRGKKAAPFETGEILVASPHLSPGYWKDEPAGKKAFSRDPKFGRLYWTGDRGRLLLDGTIEFMGRKDFQVKVRGYRIETGEIESYLLNHPCVKETVVTAKTDGAGEQFLAAYFTGGGETEAPRAPELRRFLAKDLPDYMIPAYFVHLECFPLNPTGKIDRNALPEPEIKPEDDYAAPRDEIERKLVDIWAGVLGNEPSRVSQLQRSIGIDDNFFEIGGHSLKATILLSRIHREFHVKIPLAKLFRSSDIRGLAGFIRQNLGEGFTAVRPVEKREYYPQSSAQKRLFLLDQLENTGTGYNIPNVFRIKGKPDKKRLENVFYALIARHEVLRTSFHLIDDEPVQRVYDEVEFKIEEMDVGEDEKSRAADAVIGRFMRPFDLSEAPLLRAGLARLPGGDSLFLFDMHHIISDGTSKGILGDHFIRLYEGELPAPAGLQYKDFALWRNSLFETGIIEAQERYWLDLYSGADNGEIPRLNIPTDYPRPAIFDYEGESCTFESDTGDSRRIKKLSVSHGVTLYMTLLAAFNVLLYKYTGQEDIIVGSVVAGRPHADLQDIIGMFVNTLAMRNYPMGDKTYLEFLKEVKQGCIAAYENQDLQFEDLVDKLNVERDPSRNPLFDVTLLVQNFETSPGLTKSSRTFSPYYYEKPTAIFDLSVTAVESSENIRFMLEYRKRLFRRETVLRLKDHFVNVLKAVCETPGIRLSDIAVLSPGEKQEILYVFNDTAVDFPGDKTIHQLFEDRVARTPDRAALTGPISPTGLMSAPGGWELLTYSELNRQAGRLAHLLREKGVRPGTITALMVERSVETVVGLLGILKTGGAYLPIDPGFPGERVKYMLDDSNAGLSITTHPETGKINVETRVCRADRSKALTAGGASGLAYVIYTSGSTGRPRGVMIEHRSVVNFIKGLTEIFDFREDDTVLSLTTISFDIFGLETFLPLTRGCGVLIGSEEERLNPGSAAWTMVKKGITILQVTPSRLTLLLSEEEFAKPLRALKYLLIGGEALPGLLLEKVNELTGRGVYNLYGPTETTIWSTVKDVGGENELNIGKPIANTQIYILSRGGGGTIQPIGAAGELCIAGAGLARGYLNDPEQTAAKFNRGGTPGFPAPFYRTGDFARWLPDGNIEFLGRIDNQVKIRGYRIEPGEIEAQLLAVEGIKEAAVTVREDSTGKYLCAYIVPVHGRAVDTSELRREMSNRFPDYMVPGYFVPLERLPLTAGGKIDRKALPAPGFVPGGHYTAPRNRGEETLAGIWSGVLGIETGKIGIDDNFFDLGGHSLKAAILVSRIHKEFLVKVPLIEVFKRKTIRELAQYIHETAKTKYTGIEPTEKREYYPLSSAQRRLWFLQQMDPESTTYNIPMSVPLGKDIDKTKIESTLKKLAERHESLRTSFETIDEEPVQRIHDHVEFEIDVSDSGTEFFIRPFDLSRAPLMRSELHKLPDGNFLWMVDMHHIISDGTSLTILTEDFKRFYNGEESPLPRLHYKDFSQWQNSLFESGWIKKQEEYWLSVLQGEIPRLELPLDYKRPEVFTSEGGSYSFTLEQEDILGLGTLGSKYGATLYMNMLAVLNTLFYKYTGHEDILIGSAVAGRPHADLQHIIGMFVNTLVMRNRPGGEKTYASFLEEVAVNSLNAFENQDVPFEELVDMLDPERDTSRTPLFDVMMTGQNFGGPAESGWDEVMPLADDSFPAVDGRKTRAKFDLTFFVYETEREVRVNVGYYKAVFRAETVRRLGAHFKNVVKAVAHDPTVRLKDIEIVSEAEKKRLIVEFNDTARDYPRDRTIHQLFEEQAAQAPDRLVLIGPVGLIRPIGPIPVGDRGLVTYGELNRRADGLARRLRRQGVRPGTVVALTADRSVEVVAGLLGILKAGCGYLPIDPNYPEERKKYMLTDSNAGVLLNQESELSAADILTHPTRPGQPTLAYVLYTSGTTGRPKGVMVEHRNVVRLVKNTNFIVFDPRDRILQTGALDFDASTFEIWGALLNGLTLCLVPGEEIFAAGRLKETLRKFDITVMWMTSPLFNQLAGEDTGIFGGLRYFLVGGDVLSPVHINMLKKRFPRLKVINGYGPTENTTFSTTMLIEKEYTGTIPIGRPIANSTVYILDTGGNPCPVNVPGEICVGGDGVARGYLNQPEVTAERFFNRSYKTYRSYRTYKTGDRGRRLPDGTLEFLGRLDNQVKIRGFRIEPEEIESHLLAHGQVEEAVVLAKTGEEQNPGKFLCAYVVPQTVDIEMLKEYLSLRLPRHMVPALFVPLERLPLTSNGKIDKKALSLLGEFRGRAGGTYITPETQLEKQIAEVWKETLNLDDVGLLDNFFDIGGNSINLLKVHNKLEKMLEIKIPVVKLFEHATVRSLSLHLKRTGVEKSRNPGQPDKEKTVSLKGVAVIGMACIFPGARDTREFWENLINGVESITFFTPEELEEYGTPSQLSGDPDFVKAKGVVEGEECFDAAFFGYTPREAAVMDPQVRMFHRCVWHALEDGGYDSFSYPRRIGIYAGAASNVNWEILAASSGGPGGQLSNLLRDRDFMCTHIAYKLNLKGPAYSVNTACSTALTAIHLAVRALLNRECEMALAGGVNVSFPQQAGYLFQEGMIQSPDGHCRAFDARSRGIVGGNGAGVVLLKPYEDALADGDHVYAVIKGTAVNNDGLRKVGYSAPSVEGQSEVVREARETAGFAAETISYIEAHGTGTELGDPVEVEALKIAFNTAKRNFCGIGSVKTNVGHLSCAAGAAGFIKTVLALKHRLIPPTLHFQTPNPKLDIENSPFYVVNALTQWKHPEPGVPLRAGVSSLGIGGTNAHVVLEEMTEDGGQGTGDGGRAYRLVLLSAKTPSALDRITADLVNYLEDNLNGPISPGLPDIAYTLQVGRRALPARKMAVCSTVNDAVAALSPGVGTASARAFLERDISRPIVFVFSGQGSQYINMGLDLYRTESLFRQDMDRCFEILGPLTGCDIKQILYPGIGDNRSNGTGKTYESYSEELNRPEIVQSAIFCFEYALARLLLEWGITPAAMIGYSLGEYTAACLSGVFSLEDALTLVAARGELIRETPPGAMSSVPLTEEEIAPLLNKDISLAIVNGPSCVVAGPAEAVETFEKEMKTKKRLCTRVNISHAVHSHLMSPIREEFENRVKGVTLNDPRIPFISNVGGTWISREEAKSPRYWGKHLCAPVRFSSGIGELLKLEDAVFIEIGPGRVLGNLIRRHPGIRPGHMIVNLARHQPEAVADDLYLLRTVGRLWLGGVDIDWERFQRVHPAEKRRRVPLPVYPFEAVRYRVNDVVYKRMAQWQSTDGGGAVIVEGGIVEAGDAPSAVSVQPSGPESFVRENEYVAPRNELEENMALIWREFLGFEEIGVYDNFFHLNGDSLTATQFITRLKDIYPVEVTLQDFYEEPTIDHLAKTVRKLLIEKIKSLSPGEKRKFLSGE